MSQTKLMPSPALAFLKSYFAHMWSLRPKDIEYRASIDIQAAFTILKEQSRLTRAELCSRLNVDNSRLAYIEARGSFTQAQFQVVIQIAEEYSMPNLAHYFASKMRIAANPVMPGDKTRRRRVETGG